MREPLESYDRNHRQKKRGERFSSYPNPLKASRLAYGYTQQDVANQLSMSRQVIVDVENGCYLHPPPKYVAYLAQYDAGLRGQLTDAYYAWRQWWRSNPDDPEGPTVAFQALQDAAERPTTFQGVMTSVTGGSTRGFARMLILQTSVVNDYVKKGHHWMQIEAALKDVGLSPTFIALLKQLPRTEAIRRNNLLGEKNA